MAKPLLAPAVLLCLAGLAGGWSAAAREPHQTAASQEPRVTITPRATPSKPAPQPEGNPRQGTIRVDTSLVLIPVTVTDPLNRFVTGLEKSDFRVFEDSAEQQIATFASEDAPMSMGLVFDTSGSMGPKLQRSRQAIAQLMRTANPEDEFFLVRFSNTPELMIGFTKNAGDIQQQVMFTQSKGSTALLDAIYLSLAQMKKAQNARKALVVISDGGDNHSRYTVSEVNNVVREADVQIYAMGIFGGFHSSEELSGPELLTKICEQTGGRHYVVGNLAEMSDIANKISIELRNEYVLGYNPGNKERDGKYRRVRVKVITPRGMPPLRPNWRHGYYAPSR